MTFDYRQGLSGHRGTGANMSVVKVSWSAYRETLYPLIVQTQQRNQHQFADDIDDALSNGSAFLFVGEDGFFVLEPKADQRGTVRVTILFAFNWGGQAIDRYQKTVEKLTREIGGRALDVYTKVSGLTPLLTQQGWQLVEVLEGIEHWEKTL